MTPFKCSVICLIFADTERRERIMFLRGTGIAQFNEGGEMSQLACEE